MKTKYIYYPPKAKSIDNFVHEVTSKIAEEYGPEYKQSEVVKGFTEFLKVAARVYANHLTRNNYQIEDISNG